MRKHVWICTDCHHWHIDQKPAVCLCSNKTFWYCMSKREAERAAHLLLLAHHKEISELEFQPAFHFTENDVTCFTYKADFRYVDGNGVCVIEDVKASKNPKAWDPVFSLKKKLIEARYEIDITIVN